jgi:hypothetical protein
MQENVILEKIKRPQHSEHCRQHHAHDEHQNFSHAEHSAALNRCQRKPARRGHRAGSRMGWMRRSAGTPHPDVSTGIGCSKMGNWRCRTKNPRPGRKRDFRDGGKSGCGVSSDAQSNNAREVSLPASPVAIWPTKTRSMVGYHRAGSRMEQKHDAWFKSAGPGFYHRTRPLENGGKTAVQRRKTRRRSTAHLLAHNSCSPGRPSWTHGGAANERGRQLRRHVAVIRFRCG